MISTLARFKQHIANIPGARLRRKIVVFESDDWGMIRMDSKESLSYFERKGLSVRNCIYNSNDCLETNSDLEDLFEVLDSVRDSKGNACMLTANTIVANPDFQRIQDSDFQNYFYEPFTVTLSRYNNRERVIDLYREGIERNVFKPQFHGKEHVNVENWMRSLQSGNSISIEAFKWNMFSVHATGIRSSCKGEYLDSFGNPGMTEKYVERLMEGLDLFREIHGYCSRSFIAPCYTWSDELNKVLREYGVIVLQGSWVQKEPSFEKKGFKKKYHYTGEKNREGQIYLVRNAHFEVSENRDKDWVDSCLKQISLAFRYGKPAIISVHRVCFMGGIEPKNRDCTLAKLSTLLKKILVNWPEAEFMSSDRLGELMLSR